jgi:hypothetical protein
MQPASRAYAAALLLLSAACGSGTAPAPAAQTSRQQAIDDADFGLRMALLEGHLRIGNALMEAGQKDNALPHFGHPVQELYGDMAPYIAAHHGQQFDRDLIALEALAARGDAPQYRAAFAGVMRKVVAGRALIPADRFNSDEYTMALAADVCTSASQEYRNAIVAGHVGSLVEYEDARGFMMYSSDLLANHRGGDPRLARMAALSGELNHMVEPLDPPEPIRGTPEDFEARATAIRAVLKPAAP